MTSLSLPPWAASRRWPVRTRGYGGFGCGRERRCREIPRERGFKPLPKRWVVERTFAWLGRNRRLAKDYEENPRASEAWVYLGMLRLLVKRLARAA